MFTLKLFLMGLVALVPSTDGRNLTIVLPEARTTTEHHHFPVLVYPCGAGAHSSCIQGDARKVAPLLGVPNNVASDGFLFRNTTATHFGALLLDGVRIELAGLPPGRLRFAESKRKSHIFDFLGATPHNCAEVQDFSWVPPFSRMDDKVARIDPRHLYRPNDRYISALLPLSGVGGRVQSFRVATVPRRVVSIHQGVKVEEKVDFVAPLSYKSTALDLITLRQASADVVVVEFTIQGTELTIHFSPFGGGESEQLLNAELVLRPVGDVLELLLGNLSPDRGDTASQTSHFDLYYLLAERQLLPPRRGPRLGMKSRWREANGINPRLPPVVEVVSIDNVTGGGVSRPVCTLVTFANP